MQPPVGHCIPCDVSPQSNHEEYLTTVFSTVFINAAFPCLWSLSPSPSRSPLVPLQVPPGPLPLPPWPPFVSPLSLDPFFQKIANYLKGQTNPIQKTTSVKSKIGSSEMGLGLGVGIFLAICRTPPAQAFQTSSVTIVSLPLPKPLP